MGTFFHPITIIGPDGEATVDALVDTALMFASVPSPILNQLAVVALDRSYDGRRVAQVEAELAGQCGHIMCVFGSDNDTPRIGRHTLDSFLLDVDEHNHVLVEKVLNGVKHF